MLVRKSERCPFLSRAIPPTSAAAAVRTAQLKACSYLSGRAKPSKDGAGQLVRSSR